MGRFYCKRSSINRIVSSQIFVGLQNSTISLSWTIWINIVFFWYIVWGRTFTDQLAVENSEPAPWLATIMAGWDSRENIPPPHPRSPVWPVTRSARTSPLKLPPPGSSPPTINQDPGFRRPPLQHFCRPWTQRETAHWAQGAKNYQWLQESDHVWHDQPTQAPPSRLPLPPKTMNRIRCQKFSMYLLKTDRTRHHQPSYSTPFFFPPPDSSPPSRCQITEPRHVGKIGTSRCSWRAALVSVTRWAVQGYLGICQG